MIQSLPATEEDHLLHFPPLISLVHQRIAPFTAAAAFFFFFFQLAGCFCVERSSSFPSFGPKSADSEFFTTCSSLLPHRSTPISIAVDESRPDHHPTPSSDRRGTKNRVLEQRPILSAPSDARCRTVRRKKGLDHFES